MTPPRTRSLPAATSVTAERDTDLRNASLPRDPQVQELTVPRTLRTPARIARHLADQPELWQPLLRYDQEQRWYTRLAVGAGWEAWLLTWLPGQGTDLHDHGGSAGAFTVLSGDLQELTPARTVTDQTRLATRNLTAPRVRAFGPSHIHQVLNGAPRPAASLHVYRPALTVMNRYELDPERGPVIARTEKAGQDW